MRHVRGSRASSGNYNPHSREMNGANVYMSNVIKPPPCAGPLSASLTVLSLRLFPFSSPFSASSDGRAFARAVFPTIPRSADNFLFSYRFCNTPLTPNSLLLSQFCQIARSWCYLQFLLYYHVGCKTDYICYENVRFFHRARCAISNGTCEAHRYRSSWLACASRKQLLIRILCMHPASRLVRFPTCP